MPTVKPLHLAVLAAVEVALVAGFAATLSSAGAPARRPAPAAKAPTLFALGGRADELAIGLAVRRAAGGLEVEATALGTSGSGVTGLQGAFVLESAGGREQAAAATCGPGCYRAVLPHGSGAARPRVVTFTFTRKTGRRGEVRYPMPSRWPPPPAAGLLQRADRVYRGLSSVVYDERLTSGLGKLLKTRFVEAAPDRLSYRIVDGADAVLIGGRRWDRQPGGKWRASEGYRSSFPAPPWRPLSPNAFLVGSTTVAGRRVDEVSLRTRSGYPIWYTVWLDHETLRPLKLRMITAAHFMTLDYRAFNNAAPIVPPRSER
jgi:hypothetical protein